MMFKPCRATIDPGSDDQSQWWTKGKLKQAHRQGWITSAHVRYYMTTKQNFRRERDLWFVSRFKKTHCQQRWSKGVLFLHSTSTVLAFASQTIIWIRTDWILTFWERNVGWNMNYDLFVYGSRPLQLKRFHRFSSSNNGSWLRRNKPLAKKIVMIHWQRYGSVM